LDPGNHPVCALRSTCSSLAIAVAIACHVSLAVADEPAPASGQGVRPRTSVTFEAMPLFVRNDPALRFDSADSKLGNLGALQQGDRGLQGRVSLTHAFDEAWDTRISASMLYAGEDEKAASYLSGSNVSTARQSARAIVLDAEVGHRFKPVEVLDVRLFAGFRALRATAEGHWATSASDKLGQRQGSFFDTTHALGPRVGADVTIPVSSRIDLLASGSVSALNGHSRSRYTVDNVRTRDNRWILGADAMAGVALHLGDGASLTAGYRVEHWRNLAALHTGISNVGAYETRWGTPTLSHGPVLRFTVPLGGR